MQLPCSNGWGYGLGGFYRSRKEAAALYLKNNGIELTGESVSPDKLQEFVNDQFGERIGAMEHEPSISVNDAMVPSGAEANTINHNGYKAGASDIYLRERTLRSNKMLYLALDHELTHAEHFSNGTFAGWANKYGIERAKSNSEFYAYHGSFWTALKIGSPLKAAWSYEQMMKYIWK